MTTSKGKIIKIKKETYDVKTFRIKLEKKIKFVSGQYCLVSILNKKGVEGESRPLTFTNSPTEKKEIELTVKKMGKFTSAMYSLNEGNKLEIDGPYGNSLNFDESVKEKVVFLAGGSGITPFISAIRYSLAKDLPNDLFLLFSNRTKKDIIYEKELERINKAKDNISIVFTLTTHWPKGWKGETGRINREMIEKYLKKPKERLWYICGPPPMIEAMKKILREMEIPEKNLRVEDWQIPGKHDFEN